MAELIANARTSAAKVKEVFDTEMTAAQVNAFINMASRLVTNELTGIGLNTDTLSDIELMLSCHFCALNDPRMKSENVAGEWSFTIQGQTGMHLNATFYGQQAKLFDTTGTLDRLGDNLKKASITVLKDVT